MALFRDRRDAGRRLAEKLRSHAERAAIIFGLPRGGVPVAAEVAEAFMLPLDVFIVRKLGVPGHEELAMGAIASGGVRVMNEDLVKALGIPAATVEAVTAREAAELDRRERAYRGNRPPFDVTDAAVILVDDGLATGATMRAGVRALRQRGARAIVVAVPVGSPETCGLLAAEADHVVCAAAPEPFLAVGFWYDDFSQTTDEEVRQLLAAATERAPALLGNQRGRRVA